MKINALIQVFNFLSNDILDLTCRDNFLKIVVYYGDLSYEYLEQKPTYDLLVFLGNSKFHYPTK